MTDTPKYALAVFSPQVGDIVVFNYDTGDDAFSGDSDDTWLVTEIEHRHTNVYACRGLNLATLNIEIILGKYREESFYAHWKIYRDGELIYDLA